MFFFGLRWRAWLGGGWVSSGVLGFRNGSGGGLGLRLGRRRRRLFVLAIRGVGGGRETTPVVFGVLVAVSTLLALLIGMVLRLTSPHVSTVAVLLRFRLSMTRLDGVIEFPAIVDVVIEILAIVDVVIEIPIIVDVVIREWGVETEIDGVGRHGKLEWSRRVTNGGSWGTTRGRVVTGRGCFRSCRLRWRVVGYCRCWSDGGSERTLRECGV